MISRFKNSVAFLWLMIAVAILAVSNRPSHAEEMPFTFPFNWTIKQSIEDEKHRTWVASPSNSDREFINFQVLRKTMSSEESASNEKNVKTIISYFLSNSILPATREDPNIREKCGEQEPITINSYKAVMVQCVTTNGKLDVHTELLAISYKNYIFLTYFMTREGPFEKYYPVWKSFLSSLK